MKTRYLIGGTMGVGKTAVCRELGLSTAAGSNVIHGKTGKIQ